MLKFGFNIVKILGISNNKVKRVTPLNIEILILFRKFIIVFLCTKTKYCILIKRNVFVYYMACVFKFCHGNIIAENHIFKLLEGYVTLLHVFFLFCFIDVFKLN